MTYYCQIRQGLSAACVKVLAFFIFAIAGSAFAIAEEQQLFTFSSSSIYQTLKTDENISIDGLDKEPIWLQVPEIGQLHQVYPKVFEAPMFRSVVKVMYDDTNFYVLAKLYDKDMANLSRSAMAKGQGIWQDDLFGIAIDTFNSQTNGYYFATNPNGFKEEGLISDNDTYMGDWDGLWQVATSESSNYWTVEIAIPFSSLSFGKNHTWGINVFREIKRPEQHLYWTSQGKTLYPWAPEYMGKVQSIAKISQGKGVDIQLSGLSAQSFDRNTGNISHVEPSLDISYKITPSITSVLTVNTDFSATEVDKQQINLTRFSLFTPEKRKFFLEGADIFDFGNINGNAKPFFSRQMGLSSRGEPLDINAGIKISGQTKDTRFGIINVNQQQQFDSSNDISLSVIRVNQKLTNGFDIGGIFTNGSLDDKGNTLWGTDVQYRNKHWLSGDTIEISGWYQQSEDTHYKGVGKSANVTVNLPNEYFAGKLSYTFIDDKFNPGLGFINRRNIKSLNGFASLTSPLKSTYFNNLYHNVNFDYTKALGGIEESSFLGIDFFDGTTTSQQYLKLSLNRYTDTVSEQFHLIDRFEVLPGKYKYHQWQLQANTDSSEKTAYSLTLNNGHYYNGKTTNVILGLSKSISRFINTSLELQHQSLRFPTKNFDIKALSAKIDLSLSTTLFWNNWAQYNNVSRNLSVYSRIVWEPNPSTTFSFVMSKNYLENQNGSFTRAQEDRIAKIKYRVSF